MRYTISFALFTMCAVVLQYLWRSVFFKKKIKIVASFYGRWTPHFTNKRCTDIPKSQIPIEPDQRYFIRPNPEICLPIGCGRKSTVCRSIPKIYDASKISKNAHLVWQQQYIRQLVVKIKITASINLPSTSIDGNYSRFN